MNKHYSRMYYLLYALIAFCAVFCTLSWFFSLPLFIGAVVFSLGAIGFTWYAIYKMRASVSEVIDVVSGDIILEKGSAIENFPLPTAVVEPEGEILWYNNLFRGLFPGEEYYFGHQIHDLVTGLNVKRGKTPRGTEVVIGDRHFTAFVSVSVRGDREVYVIYFFENTALKRDSIEYIQSRPTIFSILIDNYDDVLSSYKDSERARIAGEVENRLEEFIGLNKGILIKANSRRYFAIVEYRYMDKIIENRFSILDDIRTILVDEKVPITLSVGVGMTREDDLSANMQNAQHALDMALGRGGDQVAIKTINGYDFFGGISKGVEKRTKVRARIIASAIRELFKVHKQVLLMGHHFSDLDAIGSAAGLCCAARQMGTSAFVVVDFDSTMAMPLIEKLQAAGHRDLFVDMDTARAMVNKETLVVVTDTHTKTMVECPDLLDHAKDVMVVDHHRKRVDFIENAVLFYHEPYASSASEMVAELLQYINYEQKLDSAFAEALLSGMVLDTKNFAVKTGVKTFEAAAYLRSLGADTVEVKKLFALSMEEFKHRTSIVTAADIYRGCAIAKAPRDVPDIRTVSSQAADELLEISRVKASFVIYPQGSVTNISARSMGQLNVQVVLESLGGGGHHTMAGAQLSEIDADAAVAMLKKSIDVYYAQNHIEE